MVRVCRAIAIRRNAESRLPFAAAVAFAVVRVAMSSSPFPPVGSGSIRSHRFDDVGP